MKEIIYDSLDCDEQRIRETAAAAGILPQTAKLLFSRGYRTEDDIKRFLTPGKHNFNDPFLLKGMKETVTRLACAKENGETVLIYGDYDADGISASAIMYRALTEYGINAINAVPERADGYGLNEEIVAAYAEDYFIDLVITVDCGISDFRCVEFIKNELGCDVIVTDHHEIPDIIPDTVVINPKLPDQEYPFDGLCGAGVALKVAYALLGDKADKYLDLAALATVADSMSLTGENRDIVYEGLKIFRSKNLRPAYAKLLESAGAKEINAQTLAFTVAPRINAAGRMGDAAAALKLFLSDDENEIFDLAAKLTAYNIERQAECDKLYKSAKEKLNSEGAFRNVIMLYDENWKTGFVGIVAAKLTEEFSRPVIMFAGSGEYLKGSARSIDGVNIFEAISANKDYLIEFGGHSQAAGVAVSKENFGAFYSAVDEYLGERYGAEAFMPKIYAECEIHEKFPMDFAEELELLEPCGVGNKKPLFVTEVQEANAAPIKPMSPHVIFSSPVLEMLWFGGDKKLEILNLPITKKIVFEPNVSVFNKQKSLKGLVKDCLPVFENSRELEDCIFEKQIESLLYNECAAEEIDSVSPPVGRYGTAYVVSDPENANLFGLPVCVFTPPANLQNSVIIAPTEDLRGFKNVIYADNPPKITVQGRHTYVNKNVSGRRLFKGVSTDRSAFAEIFVQLKAFVGRKYVKAADFYVTNRLKCDKRQFIFCVHVFTELGIFDVSGGVLRLDTSVKSNLRKSSIYLQTEEILSNV